MPPIFRRDIARAIPTSWRFPGIPIDDVQCPGALLCCRRQPPRPCIAPVTQDADGMLVIVVRMSFAAGARSRLSGPQPAPRIPMTGANARSPTVRTHSLRPAWARGASTSRKRDRKYARGLAVGFRDESPALVAVMTAMVSTMVAVMAAVVPMMTAIVPTVVAVMTAMVTVAMMAVMAAVVTMVAMVVVTVMTMMTMMVVAVMAVMTMVVVAVVAVMVVVPIMPMVVVMVMMMMVRLGRRSRREFVGHHHIAHARIFAIMLSAVRQRTGGREGAGGRDKCGAGEEHNRRQCEYKFRHNEIPMRARMRTT